MFAFITTQRKGLNSQKQVIYHIHDMFSTFFETHASWAVVHYAHQSLRSAAQIYNVPHPLTHLSTYQNCGHEILRDRVFIIWQPPRGGNDDYDNENENSIWAIFSENPILHIQIFVVLQNCTVCFTRRLFSYKKCHCEISCTKSLYCSWLLLEKEGLKDHILSQKTPPNQQNLVPREYNIL